MKVPGIHGAFSTIFTMWDPQHAFMSNLVYSVEHQAASNGP